MNSAATLPKVCTTCGARYAADVLFCPADGTPLTSVQAAQLAARASDAGAADPYLGREIVGHIEIRQLAGVGAMGRVYRAFQKGIDRDVAVKILHRELSANAQLVTRFHREAKVASRLQHPNVVQVHLAGQLPDGAMYIVMEYLDGLSLQSALAAAGGAMPLPRALHVALQLCDAAGEGHAQGVVHRDLKPENVMLIHRGDDPDYVKVLDFGIARLNWGEQSMATAAGLIFGTARYISPEGAQGEVVGPAGDVYSIATLVYQMLSGRTPFEGEQAVGLLVQQIHDPPPPLKAIPRAAYVPDPIAHVIMANLAKDPAARAQDARALGRALLDGAKASGLSPEDLVPRSVLLGARGAMHLPAIQRTRQMQLDRISGIGASGAAGMGGDARNTPTPVGAYESPSGGHAVAPPHAQHVATPSAPMPPVAQTVKWTPPAPIAPARPSNVDITLDDATATPPPVLADASPRPGTGTERPPGFPPPHHAPSAGRDVVTTSPTATSRAPAAPRRPSSAAPSEEEVAGLPRRGGWRGAGIVLLCFLLGIGITTVIAYKMNLVGPASHGGTVDDAVARATDALRHKRWDTPPGDNVRDLTNAALARWPNEPRLADVRARATDELVKEAVGRKFAGDLTEALHLARLARELDPTDTTAQHLVQEYEAESARAAGPILVLPASDAGAVQPSPRAPVTTSGPFRTSMEIAPAKPRVGQPVDLVVKVTTASGAAPRKPIDGASFVIGGAAMGSTKTASLPATADGAGVFRATFTFLAPGKYEITFEAKSDGVTVKASHAVVASEPPPQPPAATTGDGPPPAPSASVKWL